MSVNANGLCDTIEFVLFTYPIPSNEPVSQVHCFLPLPAVIVSLWCNHLDKIGDNNQAKSLQLLLR